ncbi:MAG: FAD-binding protein [Vicinamibacterales bacterium]
MSAAPDTIDAVCRHVAASRGALRVAGAGTKRRPGRDQTPVLALTGLAGIVAYDPAECVVTALGGTPVSVIEAALAAHGQYLPFDPPLADEGATVGGVVASGWSGPSRYRYGGVRDFLIGARIVDGRGRLVVSGGQVVKNAAGFLTHHALVGSAGRLGVIVEASLKVFPRPVARATVTAAAPSLESAVAAHERVRLANLDPDALDLDAATRTVSVRLAGASGALDRRVALTRQALALDGDVLTGAADAEAWAAPPVLTQSAVAKIPSAPSRLLDVLQTVAAFGPARASVGGSLVFLAPGDDLAAVSRALDARGWRGVMVRGARAGEALGRPADHVFASRVRQAIDPDARFA